MQYSECWNLRFRTGKWSSPLKRFYLLCGWNNCCFSHDITKIQTTKLSILPRFYFHDVLEQLKTNFQTNFRSKKVLSFVIEYAWISKLLRDAAFTWRPRELSRRLKKMTNSGEFSYLNSSCIRKSITLMLWVLRKINSRFCSKTR